MLPIVSCGRILQKRKIKTKFDVPGGHLVVR
jgi:hypothetical protein